MREEHELRRQLARKGYRDAPVLRTSLGEDREDTFAVVPCSHGPAKALRGTFAETLAAITALPELHKRG